jgi:NAD+ diphosphatase
MMATAILFLDGKIVLNNNHYAWPYSVVDSPDIDIQVVIPLLDSFGLHAKYYAVVLNSLRSLSSAGQVSARQLMLEQGFAGFSRVGKAIQLVNWHSTHRYCGRCGAQNILRQGANVLQCPACGLEFYPRINPCVIVLVTRGREVLLARSNTRGTQFFSCLAGYVEPGESAEDAILREVSEEAGIRVHKIRYVSSQSWPFPSQLMLGYFADYLDGELTPCPEELAEAHWYDVASLPLVPSAGISVAGQLIELYRQLVSTAQTDMRSVEFGTSD